MKEFSEKYLSILNGELSTLNLTRIVSEEDFYNKQILDSVYPVQEVKEINEIYNKAKVIYDVGFGGGFPLLPLAKILPCKQFIGLEARRKKCDAVRLIADKLSLTNVKTKHLRIELVHFDVEAVISLKAVGKIKDFLGKITSSKTVHVVFYKGPNVTELEDVPNKYLGYEKILNQSYDIDSTDGRTIIVYKGKNVPRGTQKDLVKASTL